MTLLKTDIMKMISSLILTLLVASSSYGQDVQQDSTVNFQPTVVIQNEYEPLYFLDGKEITAEEMKSIKSSDIQEINIFKDSTATNMYGSRARNGVISIKSKEKDKREK